jgi:hypothetical protein
MVGRRLVLGVAVLVSSGAAAAATAATPTVPPATWVAGYCSATVSRASADTAASSRFEKALNALKSLPNGRNAVVAFLTTVRDDSRTEMSAVHAAGVPNFPNGRALVSDLDAALSKQNSAEATAITAAKNLPTSSATAFNNRVTAIVSSITALDTQLRNGLAKYKSEVDALTKSIPACKALPPNSAL